MTDGAGAPLFDGQSLTGWHSTARVPVPRWPGAPQPDSGSDAYRAAAEARAHWEVVDGAIVGRQDPPGSGFGGYLVTDDAFGDMELEFDVAPDWPADTGVLVRASEDGTRGFQVLLDFRKSGGIGGFYGNGIGGFHALAFGVDAIRGERGDPIGLVVEDPATTLEPVTPEKRALLSYAVEPDTFVAAWRWDEWNTVRIRCVGELPRLTTWLNGEMLYDLDTATMQHPDWHPSDVLELLGRRGHIALEVHDHDQRMGSDRWARDSVVRWRNLRVTPMDPKGAGREV